MIKTKERSQADLRHCTRPDIFSRSADPNEDILLHTHRWDLMKWLFSDEPLFFLFLFSLLRLKCLCKSSKVSAFFFSLLFFFPRPHLRWNSEKFIYFKRQSEWKGSGLKGEKSKPLLSPKRFGNWSPFQMVFAYDHPPRSKWSGPR